MSSTTEEIEETIRNAIAPGFKGRLLERGLARSMIWVNGVLPEGAPNFSDTLGYDLLAYGYSLLSLSIRLKELGGNESVSRLGFEKAASAIANVIHNGDPDNNEKGFHKVLSASAYHLGQYSAKAYSLIRNNLDNENLSQIERVLSLLILRRFDEVGSVVIDWQKQGIASDEALAESITDSLSSVFEELKSGDSNFENHGFDSVELPVLDAALTDNYYSAISEYLFALETGNNQILEGALARIEMCLGICSEFSLIPQWWVFRVTRHLLSDLWSASFHQVIPFTPDHEHAEEWVLLRKFFISTLFKRAKAEVDLWPSQIEGASRAINDDDSLVVSLPTSAGKTRVAELCILRCLSIGKRVLFITPLRALSAQTESSLRKTFLPLGKTVSSLYGSIGTSAFEQDVLKTHDIVVGTPEKLDFALRNDSSIIDDVGLVILDEGHMIGLNEREINYEVQIQRLLKRPDADERRIVCLSAILPSGDQFDDFVAWLRRDGDGEAIQSSWRPTDLRFGEIIWRNNSGRIDFTVGEEQPFIPNYLSPMIPNTPNPGVRNTPFPKNAQELTLAAAWRLVQDKHTVLIYCPQRTSVNAFAPVIIDLYKRGALGTVLAAPDERLNLAKLLGAEWLGSDHPIVKCLDIGVAVHHGALPTPFRKEIENLLREGILKITVSSPTLAQGLNLSATAVIMHSLYRSGNLIEPSEFKNVIGRAGRAFVDTHGLVLHPIFDRHAWRRQKWRGLIEDESARNMESGLALLVNELLQRLAIALDVQDNTEILDYVLNNAKVWECPRSEGESDESFEEESTNWKNHIVSLDTALLSMLGESNCSIIEITETLDDILSSSLWERRLNRVDAEIKGLFDAVLAERARYIWKQTTTLQRKGYFLAGVGLSTGKKLDSIAAHLNSLLVDANAYVAASDDVNSISTIIELAEIVFSIEPFVPRNMPDDWQDIITAWLKGEVLTEASFNDINEALQFVEDGLVYRLPWGIEAIRVRAEANEDLIDDEEPIEDYELGLLVPCIENGTLNRSAALLMQAGFNSRSSAIYAVTSTNADFTTSRRLKHWLESEEIQNLQGSWPTAETAPLWKAFIGEYMRAEDSVWSHSNQVVPVNLSEEIELFPGEILKVRNDVVGNTVILKADGAQIGQLPVRFNLIEAGIYSAVVTAEVKTLDIQFYGPSEFAFTI